MLRRTGRAGDAAKCLSSGLTHNPQDLTAKLGWIKNLIDQGDIAGAIKEYRALAKQVPAVRPVLARLLIAQNQRRPEAQRQLERSYRTDQSYGRNRILNPLSVLFSGLNYCSRKAIKRRLVDELEKAKIAVSQECRDQNCSGQSRGIPGAS